MDISPLFSIVILILSVIIHEISHGYAALSQGDETAKYAGRLTLNPLPHIDIIGSIILPLIMIVGTSGAMVFGWAKPVPYNPYNLRNKRWGELFVAAAGPLSNFLLAFIFGLVIRFSEALQLSQSVIELSFVIVIVNIVLAVFNLVPIPPLDGSKILFSLLSPLKAQKFREFLERYSFVLILLLLFVFWRLLEPIIFSLVKLFTGISVL